jgi:hypothetical protein
MPDNERDVQDKSVNPRWPDGHPARTHCWRCCERITPGERYYTLTIPFGPVFGVEHETCAPVDYWPATRDAR